MQSAPNLRPQACWDVFVFSIRFSPFLTALQAATECGRVGSSRVKTASAVVTCLPSRAPRSDASRWQVIDHKSSTTALGFSPSLDREPIVPLTIPKVVFGFVPRRHRVAATETFISVGTEHWTGCNTATTHPVLLSPPGGYSGGVAVPAAPLKPPRYRHEASTVPRRCAAHPQAGGSARRDPSKSLGWPSPGSPF